MLLLQQGMQLRHGVGMQSWEPCACDCGCVCTHVCHTCEHQGCSAAVPVPVHPVPAPSPWPWQWAGCCGLAWLFCTVHRHMHSREMCKGCDDPAGKGLEVLLHSSASTDQSTQLLVNGKSGKEEAAGNVKWKPDATASH